MSLGVNMLTNSLKILHTTKTEFLEVIYFQTDEKMVQKHYRVDFKQSFGPFNMLTLHKCSNTGLFGHLIKSTFCSL